MTKTDWLTDDVPLDRPNPARIFDYLLGGVHNFEPDRAAAKKMLEIFPEVREDARVGRAGTVRHINFLLSQGIEQFLDIGSGLPTLGNVHQVAQAVNPEARVAYVDIDPVAVAHGQAILKDNANTVYIRGDIHHPEQILAHERVQTLLDFSQPMGLVLTATLVYITDDEMAYRVVRTLRDAMAPGSYIVIAHATFHGAPPGLVERLSDFYDKAAANVRVRTYEQILRFFDGFELVEPGLVHTPLWRPPEPVENPPLALGLVGVGRLPAPA